MANFKACFILENNEYKELAPSEAFENGKLRQELQGRFFYPFGDYLMEVTRADRTFFYRAQERKKYQRKMMKKAGIEVFSLDAIRDGQSEGHLDVAADLTVDIETQIETKTMKEMLRYARTKLTPEENKILAEYYENGKSDQEIASAANVTQKTINNRRRAILGKLLKMLKE